MSEKKTTAPSPENARDGLRRWLVESTGCAIQHTGWPCGTCTLDLLSRIGLTANHPHYASRNPGHDRRNEVWRAIIQIREAALPGQGATEGTSADTEE